MTATQCPACGASASGNFCSACGASLGTAPVECTACGNEVPVGGRFCNMCGTPVGAGSSAEYTAVIIASPAHPRVPATTGARSGSARSSDTVDVNEATSTGANPSTLLAAGASLVALLVVMFIVLPRLSDSGSQAAQPAPVAPFANSGSGGDPTQIDLNSMSPEEAAGRLFNRVMSSVSAGDSSAARQFAPMAISAYEMIPNPSLDSRYHVALLQLVTLDLKAARATAGTMLNEVPEHLFGLFVAAQTEDAMGNKDAARAFYQRLLDSFDAEIAANRPEYSEHSALLPGMRDSAREYLGIR